MFEAVLADLERAVDAVVVGCDPTLVTASCAMELVGRVDRLERRLGGLNMVLAGWVADSQVWKHGGDRSAAHWLAGQAGTSVADAVNTLETAARLKELPVTAAAVRDGRLFTHVRDLLATGDAFGAVIVTDDHGQVTTVAHIGHKPITLTQPPLASGHLERHGRVGAQRVTSAGPAAESELASGPAAPAGGRTREAQTRNTELDELDGNCAHHHALKTHQSYQHPPGTGRRPLHAPTGTDPP